MDWENGEQGGLFRQERRWAPWKLPWKLLEKIAGDVAAVLKTLEKATGDKKEKEDLSNTIAVMLCLSPPPSRRSASAPRIWPKAAKEDEESAIIDPAEYLKPISVSSPLLLLKGQLNFAVGVPPGKPRKRCG